MWRILMQRFMAPAGDEGAPAGSPPAAGTPPAGDPPAGTPPAAGAPPATPPVTPPAAGAPPAGTPPTGDPPPATPPATWPDDWRERYAGQDQAKLNTLKRYASPQAALDALFATKEWVSKGKLVPALTEGATPEEVTEFRKAHGIPDKADDYKLALTDGRVVGEEDAPIIGDLLKELHALHATPAIASRVVDFYYDQIEQQIADRQEQDVKDRTACEEALRQEYGAEYRRNTALVKNFLQGAGGEGESSVFNLMANARGMDGQLLMNNPDVVRAMAQWARTISPAGAFLPGGDDNAMKSIEAELTDLRKLMADTASEYWKGPKAEKHQARYRELIEQHSQISQRRAA